MAAVFFAIYIASSSKKSAGSLTIDSRSLIKTKNYEIASTIFSTYTLNILKLLHKTGCNLNEWVWMQSQNACKIHISHHCVSQCRMNIKTGVFARGIKTNEQHFFLSCSLIVAKWDRIMVFRVKMCVAIIFDTSCSISH